MRIRSIYIIKHATQIFSFYSCRYNRRQWNILILYYSIRSFDFSKIIRPYVWIKSNKLRVNLIFAVRAEGVVVPINLLEIFNLLAVSTALC
jgi:hypothetical protein